MRLLLPSHIETMIALGRATRAAQEAGRPEPDHTPVVKLFTPDAGCTWLLSELDPDEPDIAFGLCDLGQGTPELGSVRLSELASLRGPLGLPVERDRHFRPERSLIAYARDAWTAGSICA
jgi:hypothetical protein